MRGLLSETLPGLMIGSLRPGVSMAGAWGERIESVRFAYNRGRLGVELTARCERRQRWRGVGSP